MWMNVPKTTADVHTNAKIQKAASSVRALIRSWIWHPIVARAAVREHIFWDFFYKQNKAKEKNEGEKQKVSEKIQRSSHQLNLVK